MESGEGSQSESAHPIRGYVLPETTILAIIGCLDLLSTIYLLASHKAVEANPLMNRILIDFGPGGFCVFKALTLIIPLSIGELARKKHEALVRRMLRLCITLYIGIYMLSFLSCQVMGPEIP